MTKPVHAPLSVHVPARLTQTTVQACMAKIERTDYIERQRWRPLCTLLFSFGSKSYIQTKEDGVPSMKRRTAQFRFKDAIMCANATGFGTTISQAGLPRAGASVASADACGDLPEWEVLY